MDHHLAGIAHRGPHGGPQAEAHGAEAAAGEELARAGEVVVLAGPHLMLAHVGGDDGVAVGQVGDGLQNLVGVEEVVLLQGQLLPGEYLGLPGGVVVLGQPLVQQLQHTAGVPHDVVAGFHVLVDLRPVDVDMYNFGIGGEGGGIGGHPVGEAAADGDEQVALGGGHVGGVGAVHPHHAGEQGVVSGAGPAAHDGGAHRGVQPLHEGAELRHRPLRADHAAPHQHHGPLGLGDELQQLVDVPLVGLRAFQLPVGAAQQGGQPPVVGVLRQGEVLVLPLGGGDILGDVHQHRAGAAGPGDGEGLPDHVRQLVHVLHQEVAFGDGHGDSGDVHLLEGVLADEVLADVAGDEHHGGGVVVGGGDSGDQVGGPGAGGGEAHAHLPGGPGVAVGGVGRALLVGGEVVVDLLVIAVKLKLVVDVEDGAAGVAEHRVHPLLQQAFHDDLGPFHPHSGNLL